MTMLLSTDKIQLVTSAAGAIDTHASGTDWTTSTATPNVFAPVNLNITTATTTDVVPAPAAGKERTVKLFTARNKHASSSNTVTLQIVAASGTSELLKVTLKVGECLVWNERGTPFVYDAVGGAKSASTDTVDPSTNAFRLSGVSATSVMTADSTALSTIYLAQHKGNRLALFDGTNWQIIQPPTEVSLAVTGRTTDLPFDVFAVANAGVVTLEMLNWSTATARATGLSRLDGVWTKTGDPTRRYLGSIRPRSATSYHWVRAGIDLPAKFDLFNADNRIEFGYSVLDSATSHAYTLATIRQWAGSVNYQVEAMVGLAEEDLTGLAFATSRNATISIARSIGLGYDSTTQYAATSLSSTSANTVASIDANQTARALVQPGIGRHFLALLEWSTATGTCTWIGDNGGAGTTLVYQSGFAGEWTC